MTEEQYEIAKRCIDILDRFEQMVGRNGRVEHRSELASHVELNLLEQIIRATESEGMTAERRFGIGPDHPFYDEATRWAKYPNVTFSAESPDE